MASQRDVSFEAGQENDQSVKKVYQNKKPRRPRCLDVAERGVRTSLDFAEFMSALISDVVDSSITPSVANAAVNAGGKLLKVVEMQHRYGVNSNGEGKILQLTPPEEDKIDKKIEELEEEIDRLRGNGKSHE